MYHRKSTASNHFVHVSRLVVMTRSFYDVTSKAEGERMAVCPAGFSATEVKRLKFAKSFLLQLSALARSVFSLFLAKNNCS